MNSKYYDEIYNAAEEVLKEANVIEVCSKHGTIIRKLDGYPSHDFIVDLYTRTAKSFYKDCNIPKPASRRMLKAIYQDSVKAVDELRREAMKYCPQNLKRGGCYIDDHSCHLRAEVEGIMAELGVVKDYGESPDKIVVAFIRPAFLLNEGESELPSEEDYYGYDDYDGDITEEKLADGVRAKFYKGKESQIIDAVIDRFEEFHPEANGKIIDAVEDITQKLIYNLTWQV